MSRKKSVVREYVEAVLIAVVLALLIRHYVVQAFKIPSGSMIPTLLVGDHLLVNKFIYRFRSPSRGEIVVFKFPQDRETDFIKRVIALPGEEVALKDGRLLVDGVETEDDTAVYESGVRSGKERNLAPFKVPAKGDVIPLDSGHPELYRFVIANELGDRGTIVNGRLLIDGKEASSYEVQNDYFFVMGDNRDNSYDSRFWGPVNVEDLVGKAMVIYWSFGDKFYHVRWSRLGDIIH
jgi:signal peptidase I